MNKPDLKASGSLQLREFASSDMSTHAHSKGGLAIDSRFAGKAQITDLSTFNFGVTTTLIARRDPVFALRRLERSLHSSLRHSDIDPRFVKRRVRVIATRSRFTNVINRS